MSREWGGLRAAGTGAGLGVKGGRTSPVSLAAGSERICGAERTPTVQQEGLPLVAGTAVPQCGKKLAEALAAEREGESASDSCVWQQDGALLQTQKGTSRYSVRVFSSDRPTYLQIDNQPWQAAHWRQKDTIVKHLRPRRQGGGQSAGAFPHPRYVEETYPAEDIRAWDTVSSATAAGIVSGTLSVEA